jgi:hypothetical protein
MLQLRNWPLPPRVGKTPRRRAVRRIALIVVVSALSLSACSSDDGSVETATTVVGDAAATDETTAAGAGEAPDSSSDTSVPTETSAAPEVSLGDPAAALAPAIATAFGLDPSADAEQLACFVDAFNAVGVNPLIGDAVPAADRDPLARGLLACGILEAVVIGQTAELAGVTLSEEQLQCIAEGAKDNEVFVQSLASSFGDEPPTDTDPAEAELNNLALGCGVSQADVDKLSAG